MATREPSRLIKALSQVPSLLLHSPLHFLLGEHFGELAFLGRKTGNKYTRTIAFLREGDVLLLSTGARWWRNFVPAADVRVLTGRRWLDGVASVVDDREEAEEILLRVSNGIRGYHRATRQARSAAGVSMSQVIRSLDEGRKVIRIELTGTSTRD